MAGDVSDMFSFDNVADSDAIARRDFMMNDTSNQISSMLDYNDSSGFSTEATAGLYDNSNSGGDYGGGGDSFGDFSPRSDSKKTDTGSSIKKALEAFGTSSTSTTNPKLSPIPMPAGPKIGSTSNFDTPVLDDFLKKYRGRTIPNF